MLGHHLAEIVAPGDDIENARGKHFIEDFDQPDRAERAYAATA